MEEVENPAHPDIRNGLVDDLFRFDRSDADVKSGTEHGPVLGDRARSDQGRQLHHEPGSFVEPAVGERLVERKVVEHLDQLRVGDSQRGNLAREQLLMVLSGGLAYRHGVPPQSWVPAGTRRTVTLWASLPTTEPTMRGP